MVSPEGQTSYHHSLTELTIFCKSKGFDHLVFINSCGMSFNSAVTLSWVKEMIDCKSHAIFCTPNDLIQIGLTAYEAANFTSNSVQLLVWGVENSVSEIVPVLEVVPLLAEHVTDPAFHKVCSTKIICIGQYPAGASLAALPNTSEGMMRRWLVEFALSASRGSKESSSFHADIWNCLVRPLLN